MCKCAFGRDAIVTNGSELLSSVHAHEKVFENVRFVSYWESSFTQLLLLKDKKQVIILSRWLNDCNKYQGGSFVFCPCLTFDKNQRIAKGKKKKMGHRDLKVITK